MGDSVSDGLERLSRTGVAAVLLDLAMPDGPGIASFEQVLRAAPDIPILILSSPDDEDRCPIWRRTTL
jgi:DNA-binding NarL/FixJ family response regulator